MDAAVGAKSDLQFGPFILDRVRRRLTHDGVPVKLTPTQFAVLLHLAENPGRVVEKDELICAVWGGRIVEESNLSQAVFQVRRALRADGREDFILTEPGRGFRFAAAVSASSEWSSPETTAPEITVPTRRSMWHVRFGKLAAVSIAPLLLATALMALLDRHRTVFSPIPFNPPPHSIAVLAFANTSDAPNDDTFSDGLAEQLIDALSTVDQIRVVARESAFSLKGQHVAIGDIARRLNVGAVLEGSVRRNGSRVRISVHLVNAITGYQLWSRSYERNAVDLPTIQTEIATAISNALEIKLLGNQAERFTAGGTKNPQAFDAFLRGFSLYRFHDAKSVRAAAAAFQRAIGFDPSFANAHAGLAAALITLYVQIGDEAALKTGALDEALAQANEAVELAPESGLAHAERGAALYWHLDMLDADAEMKKAVILDPGNIMVERVYTHVESNMGHLPEAEAAAKKLVSLDPLTSSQYDHLASALSCGRRYEEALAALRRERLLGDVDPARSNMRFARIYLAQGKPEVALQTCTGDCAESFPWVIAIAHLRLGNEAQARSVLEKAQLGSGDNAIESAMVYAQGRDRAAALHWLNIAYKARSWRLAEIGCAEAFDPVRNAPEFKTIERRLGLSQ